jgi:hypothetical protein
MGRPSVHKGRTGVGKFLCRCKTDSDGFTYLDTDFLYHLLNHLLICHQQRNRTTQRAGCQILGRFEDIDSNKLFAALNQLRLTRPLHPDLPIRPILFLPDRHNCLQSLDSIATGLKAAVAPVGGSNRY